MINRVKGYAGGKRTGDGRVRSESWQAFWIGIERLSEMEMESMYTLHMGRDRSDARAERERKKRRGKKVGHRWGGYESGKQGSSVEEENNE